jgi:serine/threonine protein kinase
MQRQASELIGDRYQIIQILGSGSTGNTYAAKDCHSGQAVAIKELALLGMTDWKVLELFEREAQVLSNIDHPAIPKYLNYFQVETQENLFFYLVQALAPGISLASLIEQQYPLEEDQVKGIAIQILDIFDYLHSLTPPIVHRDIKPHNLIYSPEKTVYLVDFGSVQNVYRYTLTQGSTVVGTYGYMAPEQFRGQAYISSDLYGLGATLLYLLMARSPGDLPQRRLKIDFRSFVEITPRFADWLEKLLEPAPEDRFYSAREALFALTSQPSSLQPEQSAIVWNKTRDKLIVDIPFLSGKLILILLFLTVVLTILLLIFPWLILLFPFLIIWLRDKLMAHIHLKIDRQKFRLQWQWLGLSYFCQGKTASLDRIELNTRYSLNGNPITTCALIAGVHIYRFAQVISSEEKTWLMAEVKAFLNSLGQDISE